MVQSNRLSPDSRTARCKRQSGSGAIDSQEVRFARSRRKNTIVGEKHSSEGRARAVMGEVLELRGITGYVVDDKVRYQFMRLSESLHVIPITQARVNLGVICGIETSIGSIDGMKKAADAPRRRHCGPSRSAVL